MPSSPCPLGAAWTVGHGVSVASTARAPRSRTRGPSRPPSGARRCTGLVAAAVLDRVGEHLLQDPERHDLELGRQRLRRPDDGRLDHVAAGADALDQAVQVGPRRAEASRPASSASTWRTSCREARAEVAMFAIVCLSAAVSSSSRYCADSACARITASEWPTTSCTSRASRACSSRSRAISRACSTRPLGRAAPRPPASPGTAPRAREAQRQPDQPRRAQHEHPQQGARHLPRRPEPVGRVDDAVVVDEPREGVVHLRRPEEHDRHGTERDREAAQRDDDRVPPAGGAEQDDRDRGLHQQDGRAGDGAGGGRPATRGRRRCPARDG